MFKVNDINYKKEKKEKVIESREKKNVKERRKEEK